jgi:hypothetical protein
MHVLDHGAQTSPWAHWLGSSPAGSQLSPSADTQVEVVVSHLAPSAQAKSSPQLT